MSVEKPTSVKMKGLKKPFCDYAVKEKRSLHYVILEALAYYHEHVIKKKL